MVIVMHFSLLHFFRRASHYLALLDAASRGSLEHLFLWVQFVRRVRNHLLLLLWHLPSQQLSLEVLAF